MFNVFIFSQTAREDCLDTASEAERKGTSADDGHRLGYCLLYAYFLFHGGSFIYFASSPCRYLNNKNGNLIRILFLFYLLLMFSDLFRNIKYSIFIQNAHKKTCYIYYNFSQETQKIKVYNTFELCYAVTTKSNRIKEEYKEKIIPHLQYKIEIFSFGQNILSMMV